MVKCSIYVDTDRGELDVVKESRVRYEYSTLKITRVGVRIERGDEHGESVKVIPVVTMEQLLQSLKAYLMDEIKECSGGISLFINDKLVRSKNVIGSVLECFDYVTIRSLLVKYLRPSLIMFFGSRTGRFRPPRGKGVIYRELLVPINYARNFPIEIPLPIETASEITIKALRVGRSKYLLKVKVDGRKYRFVRPIDPRTLYTTVSTIVYRARNLKWVEVEVV